MPSTENGEELLATSDAVSHLLDECRMVLPGLQALFGFQMIAVFNSSFAEKLTSGQQKLHILAIVFVVVAVALVMTPAALHRQAEPHKVSDRFLRASSALLIAAMPPLAVGICIDVYLVASMVWHDGAVAVIAATVLLVVFAALWFAYPPIFRREAR